MSKPIQPKIFASDALDDLLHVKSKHSGDNWLLSYLDVFVLVVMLMVTLLSMSEFKQPTEALAPKSKASAKPKLHKPHPQVTPTVIQPDPTELPIENTPVLPTIGSETATAVPLSTPALTPMMSPVENAVAIEQRLQEQINDKIKSLGLQESIQMTVNQGFAQLDIQDKVLFQSSAAELTDAGKALLLRLLPLLKESIGLITIEGHTDDRPIKTSQFLSNWELSAARANSVLHYLTSLELEPERLRAISYADTKPIADNATEAGREKNRRVNIVIQVEDKPQPTAIEQMQP